MSFQIQESEESEEEDDDDKAGESSAGLIGESSAGLIGESSAGLIGESEVSLPHLGVSLPQLGERKLSPEIVVTDTTASSAQNRRVSTPKVDSSIGVSWAPRQADTTVDEDVPLPKHGQWDISPLVQDTDTGSQTALIQFDDVDSKLLPLPKVSSILSSGSSSLSDYIEEKVPVSEGASSLTYSDPNLLRVKQADTDASSRSPSISPHPGFYIGKIML